MLIAENSLRFSFQGNQVLSLPFPFLRNQLNSHSFGTWNLENVPDPFPYSIQSPSCCTQVSGVQKLRNWLERGISLNPRPRGFVKCVECASENQS